MVAIRCCSQQREGARFLAARVLYSLALLIRQRPTVHSLAVNIPTNFRHQFCRSVVSMHMKVSTSMTSLPVAADAIHAHPDIVKYLQCKPDESPSRRKAYISSNQHGEIVFDRVLNAPLACEDLVSLALDCDQHLYSPLHHDNVSQPQKMDTVENLRSLAELGEDNDPTRNAAATLLALNQLESAIRRRLGYTTGKAPLLKTMISELQSIDGNLSFLLQTLLLPTGLNLRNLLWHGFCGGLPRPWLSLTICLTQQILSECPKQSPTNSNTSPFDLASPDFSSFSLSSCNTTSHLAESNSVVQAWLPPSHHSLWQLARSWMKPYPACSLALLSILLEHTLRLTWCEVNESPEDCRAQPHRFYVTLDGHGQRHQHDILVHPYRSDGSRNVLISKLGGSCTALIADLFCSATGPNIRASLAHGLWDDILDQELVAMHACEKQPVCSPNPTGVKQQEILQKYASVVLFSIQMAALACKTNSVHFTYQPRFSYTASTRQSLVDFKDTMAELIQRQVGLESNDGSIPSFVSKLVISGSLFEKSLEEVIGKLTTNDSEQHLNDGWTTDQVYREHELNQILAPLGATQQLARDVVDALTKLNAEVTEAHCQLECEGSNSSLSTRQRRRYQRILTNCRTVGITFYKFAAFVVVLSLQNALFVSPIHLNPNDRLKVVERSRMVVSTVSSFLTTNTDRAYKTMEDYTKGKIIKQYILPYIGKEN